MGTDFRLREWRSWSCVPGHRKQRTKEAGFHNPARDDYSRWSLRRSKSRKSANVSTIFQQAGMVTSWSLDPGYKRKDQWWRAFLPLPLRPKFIPTAEPEEYTQQEEEFDDEEAIIRRDKALWEIDFRYGRNAVREEIGRRQMLRVEDSPQTPETTCSSREGSISNIVTPQMPLPSSPLAAYYYPSTTEKQHDPQAVVPSPMIIGGTHDPVFMSGYTFPARGVASESTADLIPRENTWPLVDHLDVPPSGYGRRASLPAITPLPPQRTPQALARIQSLPEHEPDAHSIKLDLPPEAREGSKQYSSTTGSEADDTPVSFEEEEVVQEKQPGWRQSLRLKVQTGAPLTRREMVQRFLGLDVVTWSEIAKIVVTGMVAGWGVAGMRK